MDLNFEDHLKEGPRQKATRNLHSVVNGPTQKPAEDRKLHRSVFSKDQPNLKHINGYKVVKKLIMAAEA